MAIIYTIQNEINHKVYVGSSCRQLNPRKAEHVYKLRKGTHANKHLQNSWNKYGEKNFSFSVVETCGDNCVLEKEANWIQLLKCTNKQKGYNIDDAPQDTKKSKEHRRKIREAIQKKYDNGWITRKGMKTPASTIEKISNSLRGRNLSETHKEKIAKSQHKQVCQFQKNGEFMKKFASIKAASEKIGVAASHISNCCRGKKKTAKGFTFQFSEGTE